MANLQERRDKNGRLISYSVRVHRGRDAAGRQLKPYTATFEVDPKWSEKTARKKAEAFAATFELSCRKGAATDSRQTFRQYCDYVIGLKESRGAKHTTIHSYRGMTDRIYASLGHVKLKDLRVDQLNDFYSSLSEDGVNRRTGGGLSAKTIKAHHGLISAVLEQAVREGIVPMNIATRAELPRRERREVRYFQPEEVAAIREALDREPIKWKTLVHLLLITGARRGEVLGIKWDAVDFNKGQIHICNNILYAPDIGIYEDTPKTPKSDRFVALPSDTMSLLAQYGTWQRRQYHPDGRWRDRGFLFTQISGEPLHPDSVTTWLDRFSRRHGLPHINPHAFRHTMASMLYYNGMDSVSISKRLGHAQVSTTADIYAHVIEEADRKNADILADIFLR